MQYNNFKKMILPESNTSVPASISVSVDCETPMASFVSLEVP